LGLERTQLALKLCLLNSNHPSRLGFLRKLSDLLVGEVQLALQIAHALGLLIGASLGHLGLAPHLCQLLDELREPLLLFAELLGLHLVLYLQVGDGCLSLIERYAGLLTWP
jgi:hypothetical protein